MRRVTADEAASLALLAAAAAGLGWANLGHGYDSLLGLPVRVGLGPWRAAADVHFVVNEGLMAAFFLQIGLEIRREMIEGELAAPRLAAAPILAALGGMALPALLYLACARHDPAALRGWAVPIATDIAFSLAAMQALGRRAPAGLRVFLTAIAVADDLGAILVLAVFYAGTIHLAWLAAAVLVWFALFGMNRAGVRRVGPYMAGAVLLWAAAVRSGVQPTLAGAAVAFAVPMAESGSAGRALERELWPWVAFLVLPLFGLLNAGLRFSALPTGVLGDAAVLGTALGLLMGKPLGVFGVTWLGCRLRLIRLPPGLRWRQVAGMAMLCGIGFTVSLFISDLAFGGTARAASVKAAVLAASLLAAVSGVLVLAAGEKRAGAGE
jgi:NhaA family Na+:H+ antiporter